MKTNLELCDIGLKGFLKKMVVVKYFDEGRNLYVAASGTLIDFDDGGEDEEGNFRKGFVAIASETDYDRISLDDVNKIFLKE